MDIDDVIMNYCVIMLLAHTTVGFFLFGTAPTIVDGSKQPRGYESRIIYLNLPRTKKFGKQNESFYIHPVNIFNNSLNGDHLYDHRSTSINDIGSKTINSRNINVSTTTSHARIFQNFPLRHNANEILNNDHTTKASHSSKGSDTTTTNHRNSRHLEDTATVAAETVLTSQQRRTHVVSNALKASPKTATYTSKTTLNLDRSQILNFSLKAFRERKVINSLSKITAQMSRGRPTWTSSLPQVSGMCSTKHSPSLFSSLSSSSSSSPSSSYLSRLFLIDKFNTKFKLQSSNPSNDIYIWKQKLEIRFPRHFSRCPSMFLAFLKNFPSYDRQISFYTTSDDVRFVTPPSTSTIITKIDNINDAVASSKISRQHKRDYRDVEKLQSIILNTEHGDKRRKRDKYKAWKEDTEITNTFVQNRSIESFDRNLRKSIPDDDSEYDRKDIYYDDDDNNINARDNIDTVEVTTLENPQKFHSSDNPFNSILESYNLNISSSNVSTDIFVPNAIKHDDIAMQPSEEQVEDEDHPITMFWSIPKNWKSVASKKKAQMFRNLTILPLGMLLIFLVLVILQVSRWCLEDIRESDGPHLNYTYHLSILGGRDNSLHNKSVASRSLCDANIYEIPARNKQNVYGRNGNRRQKHLSRYLLRGNSAPNGASDGLAYGCRGVVELMMKSSAGMLSNRSLASFDSPFTNLEQYSLSAPRLCETPRGSQQTLEMNPLRCKKYKPGMTNVHAGDKKLGGNKKHKRRVSRSLNNFKSEPRLSTHPQQAQQRSTRLSTLKKGSSTDSASNSSLTSLTQQQQQQKKQQKRWQRQNQQRRQNNNLFESYSGQTLGSLLVMPSRLVVAPMAVASPTATVSTLLSSNSSSTAIHPTVCSVVKQNSGSRTRHHSSPASSNSIRASKAIPSEQHENERQLPETVTPAKRLQKQHCLEFEMKEGDSTHRLLGSDYESLDTDLHESIAYVQRNFSGENDLQLGLSHRPSIIVESINESSMRKYLTKEDEEVEFEVEDCRSNQADNYSNRPLTIWKLPFM